MRVRRPCRRSRPRSSCCPRRSATRSPPPPTRSTGCSASSAQLPRGCSGLMCFGPNASVTASGPVKRISPNSCQEPDSSWPAEVQNMLSNCGRARTGCPAASMSASHALRAALKKFWLQGVRVAASRCPGSGSPRSCSGSCRCGTGSSSAASGTGRTGPARRRSLPKESSIQYRFMRLEVVQRLRLVEEVGVELRHLLRAGRCAPRGRRAEDRAAGRLRDRERPVGIVDQDQRDLPLLDGRLDRSGPSSPGPGASCSRPRSGCPGRTSSADPAARAAPRHARRRHPERTATRHSHRPPERDVALMRNPPVSCGARPCSFDPHEKSTKRGAISTTCRVRA